MIEAIFDKLPLSRNMGVNEDIAGISRGDPLGTKNSQISTRQKLPGSSPIYSPEKFSRQNATEVTMALPRPRATMTSNSRWVCLHWRV